MVYPSSCSIWLFLISSKLELNCWIWCHSTYSCNNCRLLSPCGCLASNRKASFPEGWFYCCPDWVITNMKIHARLLVMMMTLSRSVSFWLLRLGHNYGHQTPNIMIMIMTMITISTHYWDWVIIMKIPDSLLLWLKSWSGIQDQHHYWDNHYSYGNQTLYYDQE